MNQSKTLLPKLKNWNEFLHDIDAAGGSLPTAPQLTGFFKARHYAFWYTETAEHSARTRQRSVASQYVAAATRHQIHAIFPMSEAQIPQTRVPDD